MSYITKCCDNLLSSLAPECLGGRLVGGGDSMIVGSSPEPTIDIDGGQVRRIATFVLKIAFPPACVDGGHVVCNQRNQK